MLTHNVAELWKVYRLMVFNYLIGNKDDHAKNFAFIYRDGDWYFASAYDLLPSDGTNGFRTTSINDKIGPAKEDLFTVAVKIGLNRKETEEVFEKIWGIVVKSKIWYKMNYINQEYFLPLLDDFYIKTKDLYDCGYDQGPFIPYTMPLYSESKLKIFYIGRDTYWWCPYHVLQLAYNNSLLSDYMNANKNCVDVDKMLSWKNNAGAF